MARERADAASGGLVVICCASADQSTIEPVLETLRGEGHTVEMLEGVDEFPERLEPVLHRLGGEGLYVLCRSRSLPRDAVDALRDILLANHVPFGRTLTVASTRPHELQERIGASLRRVTSSSAAPRKASSGTKVGRATRVGVPTTTPRTRSAHRPPPPPPAKPKRRATVLGIPAPQPAEPSQPVAAAASEFDDDMPTNGRLETRAVPSDDAATLRPPSRVPRVQPEPEPEPEDAATLAPPGAPARPAPVEDSFSRPKVISAADLADLDELSGSNLDVGPPTERGRVPVRSGNTQVASVAARSRLDAIRTGDTALVSRETLEAAGFGRPDPQPEPSAPPAPPKVHREAAAEPAKDFTSNPLFWVAAVLGAVFLGGLVAAIATSGDDEPEADPDENTVAQASFFEFDALKDDSAAEPDLDAEPEPDREPLMDEAPDGGLQGTTQVGYALRSREVRSLDVLLVTGTAGPFDYEGARQHCQDLDVAGLRSWRVPEVGELRSLTDASMTGRGYYWTATPADTFGDEPWVWYARRGRVTRRSRDNYVVCVRGGVGAG